MSGVGGGEAGELQRALREQEKKAPENRSVSACFSATGSVSPEIRYVHKAEQWDEDRQKPQLS